MLLAIAAGCAGIVAGVGLDRATEAFDRGDYATAAAEAEQALRRGKETAAQRVLLGWSYLKLGDLGRARVELERGLALGPEDANAYYAHEGLGWIAYRGGDYERAVARFQEALRQQPGYHNAHDGLGWSYLATRDLARAEQHFTSALQQSPDDADARRGLGFVAYHRGDWKRAIEEFETVLRRHEGDTLTRSALGWAQYYKGDDAAARRIFEIVGQREPTWVDPLIGLAWVADRQGRRDEAKATFRLAIAKSAVYVATSDPAATLRTVLVARGEWVDLWRDLAWGLYQQRAFALAHSEFRALLARHRDDPDALRGLGFTLYALKRYREAVAPLERSLAAAPGLPSIREHVEIPGAPGLQPITSDAASTLAWSYYQLGDLPAAARAFRDVTARHADWPDSWSGLGWTLSKSGDRAEAERAFRRALAIQAGYPDAVSGLRALGQRP